MAPKEPVNFSWVTESVAGFAFPYDDAEVDYLANVAKIDHLITMCYEKPTAIKDYPSIKHHYLPVDDLTASSLTDIKKAIQIIREAEANDQKVGVHCQLGRGRAGTILACYLADRNGWNGKKAIEELRRLRPKSIDCDQEKAVIAYAKSIANTNH